jgi:hypothetical protein
MGIFDIFGTGDQQNAANDQIAALTKGNTDLSTLFGQGRQAISTSLANSTAPFATNLAAGQAGQGAYADATGANGAAGNARAVNNFQAGPGYQYTQDQALQNVLRGQEATGQAASGATNSDILTQASGIANQGWQQYIQNLSPFLNTSNSAAQGIAAANTNAGNQTNQSFITQGNAAYGTDAAIGNANASQALSGLNASGNFMNLAQNVFKSGAGGAPSIASNVGGGIGNLLAMFA